MLTESPTDDLSLITEAIDSISTDVSGIEKVFTSLYLAADKYKSFRSNRNGKGPSRNVMLIAVTDERGDDAQGLEKTTEICRKFAIPVYVMGVPAPFGREFTYIKYVDPDPKYDQSPNGLRSIKVQKRTTPNAFSWDTRTTISKNQSSIPVLVLLPSRGFAMRQAEFTSPFILTVSSIDALAVERPMHSHPT